MTLNEKWIEVSKKTPTKEMNFFHTDGETKVYFHKANDPMPKGMKFWQELIESEFNWHSKKFLNSFTNDVYVAKTVDGYQEYKAKEFHGDCVNFVFLEGVTEDEIEEFIQFPFYIKNSTIPLTNGILGE